MTDRLQLLPGFRSRTQCHYQDFHVNNRQLAQVVNAGDFIPPLGWLSQEIESRFRRMLLLKEPSDLRPERVPLFICPECANYGCGVITVRITRENDLIIWSDFRTERDCDDSMFQSAEQKKMEFSFDAEEYDEILGG